MRNFGNYTSITDNISELIKNTLISVDWKYSIENDNTFVINFPINLFTWGSVMKIKVINDRQCNIETSTVDWGDGNRKIKKLIAALQHTDH